MTPQQQAAINAIAAGENVTMRAVAGAGKTTTLIAALNRVKTPGLALAFNKKNADELQKKVPAHIEAKTLNALGHRVWSSQMGKRLVVDSDKTKNLLKELNIKLPSAEEWTAVVKMVALAKSRVISHGALGTNPPNLSEWRDAWDERDGDVDLFDDMVEHAARVLRASAEQAWKGLIDFDDQLYMPVISSSRFPTYQLMAVDEAQDLSPLQHSMIARCKPSQVVVVGDPAQAIYAFRGASSSSFQELGSMFSCTEYPLTVSFRCPKAVGQEARYYVSDFSCMESAPDGEVLEATVASLRPAATVICRYNAPLLSLAFQGLREQKPVNYLGRDFLSGIKSINAKHPTPSSLDQWLAKRLQESKSKGAKRRAEDQYDSLLVLHEAARRAGSSVENMIKEMMFAAKSGDATTLSTVHKAKGLEWKDVTFQGYDPYAEGEQESNINYVGVTRSQHTLRLVPATKRW